MNYANQEEYPSRPRELRKEVRRPDTGAGNHTREIADPEEDFRTPAHHDQGAH